jgi:hypothetical protein
VQKEIDMIFKSPFADTRFEYEIRHLYFLQGDLYVALQSSKPCFLIGSRGTGKTTLLRSLSWRERFNNEGLKKQLGRYVFREFIGIYIKLPDVQLDAISSWLEATEENSKRAIYSRYLELIQLQEMFEAVVELEAAGEFVISAIDEQLSVKKLLNEFGTELYFDEINVQPPTSFFDLSKSVRALRRYVEKASQQNTSPLLVLDKIGSPTQICNLSRQVAKHLAAVISSPLESPSVFFKVCFDEAETLDDFGVRVLATWVRLSSGALHHVVSFVSKPESLSETFLPNLTVQSADVTFLDLDKIKDKQFRALAEGVTRLRLREFLKRPEMNPTQEEFPAFDTERLFGKLNLNFLLEDALRESVSPFAKELLHSATVKAGLETTQAAERTRKGDDSALPIYETYLELRTKRVPLDQNAPRWSKRRASSQFTRKAMIGAYLSIMNDMRTTPRYAYADMILQLSDSCIRDFLNNLEYIFRESGFTLAQFLSSTRVKSTTQSSGLLAASKAKVKSLPTYGVNHPSSTAKLVNGLGQVTQLLQSQSSDGIRHLRSTERGIFQLTTSQNTEDTKRAVLLIVDAAEAGFLKIIQNDELMISFRVHTSLAPAFGFSYRGAYYRVSVLTADVLAIADAADDQTISRIASALFSRLDDALTVDLFSEGR